MDDNWHVPYLRCVFSFVIRYEWRKTTDVEKAALLGHFGKMGMRMGIKGVSDWKTWDDVHAFQEAYEVGRTQLECPRHFGGSVLDVCCSPRLYTRLASNNSNIINI